MIRTSLSMVLVVTLAWRAPAADRSEKGKTPRPNAIPVSELLEQMAKSPLGPGEAVLLRAVADLVEKEQAAGARPSATASAKPAIASKPAPAPGQPALPMPAPKAAPPEPRTRLAIRLSYCPAVNAAKALEEFLDGDEKSRRAREHAPTANRAIFVPEPLTNSLLISTTPQMADPLTELIAHLDAQPPTVMIKVCIAELLAPARDAKADEG